MQFFDCGARVVEVAVGDKDFKRLISDLADFLVQTGFGLERID